MCHLLSRFWRIGPNVSPGTRWKPWTISKTARSVSNRRAHVRYADGRAPTLGCYKLTIIQLVPAEMGSAGCAIKVFGGLKLDNVSPCHARYVHQLGCESDSYRTRDTWCVTVCSCVQGKESGGSALEDIAATTGAYQVRLRWIVASCLRDDLVVATLILKEPSLRPRTRIQEIGLII